MADIDRISKLLGEELLARQTRESLRFVVDATPQLIASIQTRLNERVLEIEKELASLGVRFITAPKAPRGITPPQQR